MPWTYFQSTGVMQDPEGNPIATGYSGFGDGRNNTAMEQVPNIGPIPRGSYRVGHARISTHTGPVSMDLMPIAATQTFGRSGFLVHGDNLSHTASHGCIILARAVREKIDRSTDRELTVK